MAPLDEEQQKSAINAQLTDNAFYDNLVQMSKIRKKFDKLCVAQLLKRILLIASSLPHLDLFLASPRRVVHRYVTQVSTTKASMTAIEEYKVPDCFRKPNGERDDKMRQRMRDTQDSTKMKEPAAFICQSNIEPSTPRSKHLASCCAFFVPAVLEHINKGLNNIVTTRGTTQDQLLEMMAELPHASLDKLRADSGKTTINTDVLYSHKEHEAVKNLKLGIKLGTLVLKWRKLRGNTEQNTKLALYLRKQWPDGQEVTATSLWNLIVQRTDEVYIASEDLLAVFREGLTKLVEGFKIELSPGDLKDPVRIHEKALDDYLTDFQDFDDPFRVIPEACVTDVLRCRAIADDLDEDILALQRRLEEPQEVTLADGSKATFTLLRAKNRFAREALSPTHFRCILNNLKFSFNGRESMVEMQVRVGCSDTIPISSPPLRLPSVPLPDSAGAPPRDYGIQQRSQRPSVLRLLPGAAAGPVREGDRSHARQDHCHV